MSSLTPQLIENFPFSHYADPGSIQRGRAYYKDGSAWNVELVSARKAVVLVDGDSGEYTVEIEVNKKQANCFSNATVPTPTKATSANTWSPPCLN